MTIRKSLLLTLLVFSIVFATLMTALAWSRARAALSDEIRRNLQSQASTVMQQVNAMLFERVTDLQGWRRLDLMQDLKVGDIDKRLASFLGDITRAYAGVYTGIYCLQEGRVVSASEPRLIGTQAALPAVWMSMPGADGAINIARPDARARDSVMTLFSEIRDAYSERPLATLATRFNWREVNALLELATAGTGRHALLLDGEGRALAATRSLRAQLPSDDTPLSMLFDGADDHDVSSVDGTPLAMHRLLVGHAHASPYKGMQPLGWTLLVLSPEEVAFAPIQRLLWSLLALLAVTVAIAALLAMRISAHTARPIQSLTAYARALERDLDTPAQVIRGVSEVEELSHAFNRTLDELRASRAQLVRASKLAAAGEMAAKLAHEVRTPLGIIRSSAQLINRQGGLDARGHEMMSYMINEVDRINELVTGLLDSARARVPQLEPLVLADVVRQVLDMLHDKFESRGIVVESALDAVPSSLRGDRAQLVQVLLNLLMNASQALEHGGHIRVAIEPCDGGLCLRVEDDGPGIPVEQRETVFEPFVSHRAGGIGLGLPVVREIVNLHGGSISIGSGSLGGACVTVQLPQRSP